MHLVRLRGEKQADMTVIWMVATDVGTQLTSAEAAHR
jgi:hypothetical protein